MLKPYDWFTLIEQWKPNNMGDNGITPPFLIGAIALKYGYKNLDLTTVANIYNAICTNPVDGYVLELSWCSNISAPVFSVKDLNSPDRMDFAGGIIYPATINPIIIFSSNIKDRWKSNQPDILFKILIDETVAVVSLGFFSRNQNHNSLNYEYGPFLPGEIDYINKTILK